MNKMKVAPGHLELPDVHNLLQRIGLESLERAENALYDILVVAVTIYLLGRFLVFGTSLLFHVQL